MAVDTHVHLQDFPKRFLDEISHQREVFPVVVGYSYGSSVKAREISLEHAFPFTVGLAPQELIRKNEQPGPVIELARESSPNAIGEVGLDYKWATKERQRALQRDVFVSFLELAEELSLPVVIHCRDAYDDLLKVLGEVRFSQKLVLHSFFGKPHHAQALLDSFDAYISINTIRTKEKRKVISSTELSRLVVETDSPYIARTPFEVKAAIEYIAEVKELPPEEVEVATAKNACSFFSIGEELPCSYSFFNPPNLKPLEE